MLRSTRSQVRDSNHREASYYHADKKNGFMWGLRGGTSDSNGVRVGNAAPGLPAVDHSGSANNGESRPYKKASTQERVWKRTFRRALRRAALTGHTTYRGQTLRVRLDFIPHRPVTTVPREDSKPRVMLFSWNCSGLGEDLYQELIHWLPTQPAELTFILLQETHWSFTTEWSRDGWLFCHSACEQPRQGGVLIGVRQTAVEPFSIRWQDPIPGRLMQLRCTIRGQQLDVINIYQHAWSTRTAEQNKELVGKRRRLWLGLDKLLSRLQWRSSLLMAGDFNSVLETRTGVSASGYGIFSRGQQPEVVKDRSMLMDVLARFQLCGLNTWAERPTHTSTRRDAHRLITSLLGARSRTRGRGTVNPRQKSFLAGWRSAGHLTLRARIPLFWKPWKGKTSPNQAPEAVTLQETLEQAQSPQELHGCLRRDVQTPSAKVPIPGHIQVVPPGDLCCAATTCQNADRAQGAEEGHSSQEAGATPGDAAPR